MLRRILGLLLQEWYITKRSLEIIMDTVWQSSLGIVVFGFIAKYLGNNDNIYFAHALVSGMLWWEFLRINQYSLTLNPMWNIWSRNFCNLFISPISKTEYLIAQFTVAFIKSSLVFAINYFLLSLIFNIDYFSNFTFQTFVVFVVTLAIFAWSFGLVLIGIIFRFGTRVQALSWGFIAVLQPLIAVFFPVSVMPDWLKTISLALPATYLFEINRMLLQSSYFPKSYLTSAIILTTIYFILSVALFNHLFNAAQNSGQFAKNDEN